MLKIKIDDILFWMDAIRQSDDKYRTLESFWKGQINSKVWLIEHLGKLTRPFDQKVLICGGWYGVLATLMFNSNLFVKEITSMDKDKKCEVVARNMNKQYEIAGRFYAITQDMTKYKNYNKFDLIINTACEHITQLEYDTWLQLVPHSATLAIQSNNFEIAEHVNIKQSLNDFVDSSGITPLLEPVELQTEKYKRFMIIGKRNEK